MFITAQYTLNNLSTALIFSTLELMVFLKLNISFFGIGIGFFFEMIVIFERFVNVINIKNLQMIEVDSITKKPLNKGKIMNPSNLRMKKIHKEFSKL